MIWSQAGFDRQAIEALLDLRRSAVPELLWRLEVERVGSPY